MEKPKKRRATYQDVIDSPPYKVAEIIGGELRLSSRPGGPATVVSSKLGQKLGPAFERGGDGRAGWLILWEPELHFGDEILVPDLAGWRLERLSMAPDAAFFTVPPDWICEVLSRSTEKTDREDKMPIYASAGVTYAWLVHPRRRTLEAFRLRDGQWLAIAVHKDTERVRVAPFEALELDLAVLWAHIPLPSRAGEEPAVYIPGGY